MSIACTFLIFILHSHAQRHIHNWTLVSAFMRTSSTTYHMGSEMECSIICGGKFTLIVCGVSNHLGGKVGGRRVGREGVREGVGPGGT